MAKQAFEQWMAEVDKQIENLCGISANDIDDWCYWDAWDDGMMIDEAARQAVNNAADACGMDTLV